jgi:hypothetical protein
MAHPLAVDAELLGEHRRDGQVSCALQGVYQVPPEVIVETLTMRACVCPSL